MKKWVGGPHGQALGEIVNRFKGNPTESGLDCVPKIVLNSRLAPNRSEKTKNHQKKGEKKHEKSFFLKTFGGHPGSFLASPNMPE